MKGPESKKKGEKPWRGRESKEQQKKGLTSSVRKTSRNWMTCGWSSLEWLMSSRPTYCRERKIKRKRKRKKWRSRYGGERERGRRGW